jgi:hypothetical protein
VYHLVDDIPTEMQSPSPSFGQTYTPTLELVEVMVNASISAKTPEWPGLQRALGLLRQCYVWGAL